jgi:RNA polymerase sigma factor (sigma-70 family)
VIPARQPSAADRYAVAQHDKENMDNTFAGSMSPPTLAAAYKIGDAGHIYTAVYRHAEALLRNIGRDYTEGHVDAQDMAQDAAVRILEKLAEGTFSGDGAAFTSWVNKIVWNKRHDFYRAANRSRNTNVPMIVNVEGDESADQIEHPDVSRAASLTSCRKKFLPVDIYRETPRTATASSSKYSTPEILQVMHDDMCRIRYTNQRTLTALSATDVAIVEAMLDDENPTYADVGAKVGMSAKQVENRLNTIRRRERKKREQALATTTTTK